MFEVREDSPQRDEAIGKLAEQPSQKEASADDVTKHRHGTLMGLLEYEADRQSEERMQMQIDEDYNDHLQWRPDDARELINRGQAPLVFNEGRQSVDWICGTEKRMRKDYKILPREPDDEAGAELKTKLVKYTDDANETQWHRSRAFQQAVIAGLSWLEEGINPDPEEEIIYSGWESWRNVYRDSHSRSVDYNDDARYLFRRKVIDLDYATLLLPKSREHLMAIADQHDEDEQGDDIWYLGEKLTGASETEWSTMGSVFGSRAAYLSRDGYHDHNVRQSVELMECWYRVPETVQVFQDSEFTGRVFNPMDIRHKRAKQDGAHFYETVKFRMRVMIATRDQPCIDMASPYRHGRFLLVPIWGYRRERDGTPYGVWRGMRDIQDDLNKRRSKALWSLSVNRIITEKGAVDDLEDLRQEAARPDAIIVKNANKELVFDNNIGDFQANLAMAEQNVMSIRNVGGVTNENLGRDTNATSGRAILAKQDQGSLTTATLFDNLLLAIKQAGKLRLSHIEQFYTEPKAIRIAGERKPIEWIEINKIDPTTGQMLNDVTAREADYIVDTQDYRASLAQAAMEQVFDLLGKIATFAPQVVMSVLDLVVETVDIKDKDEWVARIRKLNGQRDPSKPPTPEEQQAEIQAHQKMAEQEQLASETAKAALAKLQAEVGVMQSNMKKFDSEGVLRKVEAMYSALQAAQIVATVPLVTPAADEIAASAGLVDERPGAIPVPPAMQQPMATDLNNAGALQGVRAGIETPTGGDNQRPDMGGFQP